MLTRLSYETWRMIKSCKFSITGISWTLLHEWMGNSEARSYVLLSIWFCYLFHFLQNLATVKSFNFCLEFEDTQDVFLSLFKLFFTIIRYEFWVYISISDCMRMLLFAWFHSIQLLLTWIMVLLLILQMFMMSRAKIDHSDFEKYESSSLLYSTVDCSITKKHCYCLFKGNLLANVFINFDSLGYVDACISH